jgi:hypothetical protein
VFLDFPDGRLRRRAFRSGQPHTRTATWPSRRTMVTSRVPSQRGFQFTPSGGRLFYSTEQLIYRSIDSRVAFTVRLRSPVMQSSSTSRTRIGMPPPSSRAPMKQQVECLSNTHRHSRDRHGHTAVVSAQGRVVEKVFTVTTHSYRPRWKRFLLLFASVSLVFTCHLRSFSDPFH